MTISEKIEEEIKLFDFLKDYYECDFEKGIVIRTKFIPGGHKKSKGLGEVNTTTKGYVKFTYMNKIIRCHRYIFYHYYGYLPRTLDHINEIKTDNRPVNLREITIGQNMQNVSIHKSKNKYNFKGISFIKSRNRYVAYLVVDKKRKQIGYYKTAEDAHNAYVIAKKVLHPFWNGN